VNGEDREPQFLFQRISVVIQRFNAVLLHDGFCLPTTRISAASDSNFLHYFFSFLGNLPTEVKKKIIQRVSVLVQRFNGVLLHDSFVFEDCPE